MKKGSRKKGASALQPERPRKTWVGLYTRKAPTKRESELRIARKHKRHAEDQLWPDLDSGSEQS